MGPMVQKSTVARGLGRIVLCLAATGLAMTGWPAPLEIVAHRGASHDAPENTLPAVLLGWVSGAEAVEIDVHQTLDGRIVAIHDADTHRVTGHRGEVAQMTLEELRELDAGAWKGDRWRGTGIPTLREVLETVPPGRTLVVEVKCPGTVLPELERDLDRAGRRRQVILIAFDFDTIREAKRRMPDVPAFWLYGFSSREATRYGVSRPADLVDRVRNAGLDGLDVRHDGPWIGELVTALRAIDKTLLVYTVNSVERAVHLRDLGVAGITTDRPGYLRRALTGDGR